MHVFRVDHPALRVYGVKRRGFETVPERQDAGQLGERFFGAIFFVSAYENDVLALTGPFGALVHDPGRVVLCLCGDEGRSGCAKRYAQGKKQKESWSHDGKTLFDDTFMLPVCGMACPIPYYAREQTNAIRAKARAFETRQVYGDGIRPVPIPPDILLSQVIEALFVRRKNHIYPPTRIALPSCAPSPAPDSQRSPSRPPQS